MLKRLAVLGLYGALATVSFLVAQTSPLSPPRQGIAKEGSGGSAQKPGQPSQDQQPANSPPKVANPYPSSANGETKKDDENIEIQRRIANFTAWLVVVGGAQAIALLLTLFVIKRQATLMEVHAEHLSGLASAATDNASAIARQADLMEQQTTVLRDSVAAANASAKAANDQIEMVRQQERARIHVTPLDFEMIEPTEPNKIMIEFVNIGPTNAFDVRVEAGAKVTVEGFKPEQGEYTDLAVPTLFKPDKTESSWIVCDFPERWQSEVDNDRVRITVELIGQVKYRDVFDTVHTDDFAYRMNVYGIECLPRNFIQLKLMRKWHPFDLRPGEWEF
jgi:hypothetical protein